MNISLGQSQEGDDAADQDVRVGGVSGQVSVSTKREICSLVATDEEINRRSQSTAGLGENCAGTFQIASV